MRIVNSHCITVPSQIDGAYFLTVCVDAAPRDCLVSDLRVYQGIVSMLDGWADASEESRHAAVAWVAAHGRKLGQIEAQLHFPGAVLGG